MVLPLSLVSNVRVIGSNAREPHDAKAGLLLFVEMAFVHGNSQYCAADRCFEVATAGYNVTLFL